MSNIARNLEQLRAVADAATAVMKEAHGRHADTKQARLVVELGGRVIGANKTELEYRLAQPRLAEIESKYVGATSLPAAGAQPQIEQGPPAQGGRAPDTEAPKTGG
jgi:hypothetical protein